MTVDLAVIVLIFLLKIMLSLRISGIQIQKANGFALKIHMEMKMKFKQESTTALVKRLRDANLEKDNLIIEYQKLIHELLVELEQIRQELEGKNINDSQ